MARFFREGREVADTSLSVWNRIEEDFKEHPDEHRAARMLYRFTGREPFLWDANGRQQASDIGLGTVSKFDAMVEVSSTDDSDLRRDMRNCELLEKEMNEGYDQDRHWTLLLQRGWQIPAQKERKALARSIRVELELRTTDGYLDSAPWIFAWASPEVESRIEIGGWDSRVTSTAHAGSVFLALFLDSELMQKKREKLRADAVTLDASSRLLYLFTSPTGSNSHIATWHTWALADGSFVLPDDLDELWLDGRGTTVRRFTRNDGWTEYAI